MRPAAARRGDNCAGASIRFGRSGRERTRRPATATIAGGVARNEGQIVDPRSCISVLGQSEVHRVEPVRVDGRGLPSPTDWEKTTEAKIERCPRRREANLAAGPVVARSSESAGPAFGDETKGVVVTFTRRLPCPRARKRIPSYAEASTSQDRCCDVGEPSCTPNPTPQLCQPSAVTWSARCPGSRDSMSRRKCPPGFRRNTRTMHHRRAKLEAVYRGCQRVGGSVRAARYRSPGADVVFGLRQRRAGNGGIVDSTVPGVRPRGGAVTHAAVSTHATTMASAARPKRSGCEKTGRRNERVRGNGAPAPW